MGNLKTWRIVAIIVAFVISALVGWATKSTTHFWVLFCALGLTTIFMVPFVYSIYNAIFNEDQESRRHKQRNAKSVNQISTVVVIDK